MIDGENVVAVAERWANELKLAKREDTKWVKRGKKIVRRYRDERDSAYNNAKRYNILWANVQTLLPALYGKTPKAEVSRRWKDQDPVGRTAAMILERALQFELDHKRDYDNAVKHAVVDRLLPGRGTAWVRFDPSEQMATTQGPLEYECTPVDYVFWEDFRCSPVRTWDEVTWVARRVYMSKEEGIKRFGDDFADVPMTHEPVGLDEMAKNGDNVESLKKAQVWEIWDKSSKRVYWIADSYAKALDIVDDPYGLDSFWPCPKPLFATQTSDQLVPVPDFALYQDQADEIDLLTQRINSLVKAVKVAGVYDATQSSIQRLLSEGFENVLIPVDNWAGFSERNGLKGTVDFMPLDSVLQALQQCYVSREQAKQVVYDITGISDIIRGSSVASETATAQQIKSQYATLRLRDMQKQVAVFASEILQIKGQLMADLYRPEVLVEMSGIMGTDDAQYVPQALELIKSEPMRTYRVEVASDSLVEIDEQTEKESRMEFLTAAGTFLEKSIMAPPSMVPLLGEMLMFGVRSFKAGKSMEGAIESFLQQEAEKAKQPQPQPPNPEEIKAQAEMAKVQATMQGVQQKTLAMGEIEQFKAQTAKELEAVKVASQVEIERERAANAERMELMRQQAETERKQMEIAAVNERETYKANLDAQTKLQLAQMSADQAMEAKKPDDSMLQAITALSQVMEKMAKPKRRELVRGPDGKAAGIIEIEVD